MQSNLVTVGWAYGAADAALATAMLKSARIPVHASDYYTLSVAWHWIHALGGIRLRVPASEANAAIEILGEFQGTPSRWRKWTWIAVAVMIFFCFSTPPPSTGLVATGQSRPVRAALQQVD